MEVLDGRKNRVVWGTGCFGGDLLFELMARSDFRGAAAECLSRAIR